MADAREDRSGGRAPPLNYLSPRDDEAQPPAAVQAAYGFLLAAGTTLAMNCGGGLLATTSVSSTPARVVMVVGIALLLLAFWGTAGLGMRRRGQWPVFLSAALAGWALAVLIEAFCILGLGWR